MPSRTGRKPGARNAWLKKLLTAYLVATGIAVHVAGAALLVMAPELVHKVRERVEAKVDDVTPQWARPRVVTWDEARHGLRRWQPRDAGALAANAILVDGARFDSLQQAVKALKDGSLLELGPGTYNSGVLVRADNVRIVGRGHVVFDNAAIQGKGAFVIKGNNATLQNIECRNIKVRDRNGACVRLEGAGLTLEHVYFHSSQQGVLTGSSPGRVVIRDSFFERLGNIGRAHGIYQGGGTLLIDRSYFLGARNEGHEVKSRATETTITNSVIASLTGNDSRLVDVANGGILHISDSTLQQGPNSVNLDVIGFALAKKRHATNAVTIERNLIILERNGSNRLLHNKAGDVLPVVRDNVIVAPQATGFGDRNLEFDDREDAGLPAYPTVPDRPAF